MCPACSVCASFVSVHVVGSTTEERYPRSQGHPRGLHGRAGAQRGGPADLRGPLAEPAIDTKKTTNIEFIMWSSMFYCCVTQTALRQAEFARAVLEQQFANSRCVLRYCGILSTEQQDVKSQLGTAVYNWWDDGTQAPPKRRPRNDEENVAVPELQLLAWQDGGAIWPQSLAGKFPNGTDEEAELTKLRKAFENEFPRPRAPTRSMSSLSLSTDSGGRVAGNCDYSLDAEPLDVQRVLDLEAVAVADFSETPLLASKSSHLVVLSARCHDVMPPPPDSISRGLAPQFRKPASWLS